MKYVNYYLRDNDLNIVITQRLKKDQSISKAVEEIQKSANKLHPNHVCNGWIIKESVK